MTVLSGAVRTPPPTAPCCPAGCPDPPKRCFQHSSQHSAGLWHWLCSRQREFAGGKSGAKCPGSRVLHKPVNIPCYLDIRAHRYLRFKPPARGSHRLYAIDTLAPPETRSTTVRPDRDPAPDTRGPPRAVRSVCPIRRKPEPLCPNRSIQATHNPSDTPPDPSPPIRSLRYPTRATGSMRADPSRSVPSLQ